MYNNYLQTMTGLVMGIGNRLRSKTGGRGPSPSSASPSSLAGTATEHLPPRVSRKGSVKRKGGEIHGTAVKRCVCVCVCVCVTWLSWQFYSSGRPSSAVLLRLPPLTHITLFSPHSEIARNVKPSSAAGDIQIRRNHAPYGSKTTIRFSTHLSSLV